jgi:hypothetical protein
LFNHKALAKVFRAKLLGALAAAGLAVPGACPKRWVVDCKRMDHGAAALVYLGRYLYRGVIQERDILRCESDQVTYRWRDSRTGKRQTRTVSGATFLWLVLQHVLPKGFRRARSYGFLHPNSKRLISLLRLLVFKPGVKLAEPTAPRPALRCVCCGAAMIIVRRRMPSGNAARGTPPRASSRPASPARSSTSAPTAGTRPSTRASPTAGAPA